MKELLSEIRGAVMSTLVLAVVCCGIYPLIVFGIAQAAFHDKANGSLIVERDGTVRGSKLLGQQFAGEKYFHPRPSAAGNGYDAANSGGSNLGPTSQKLNDAIKERIDAPDAGVATDMENHCGTISSSDASDRSCKPSTGLILSLNARI